MTVAWATRATGLTAGVPHSLPPPALARPYPLLLAPSSSANQGSSLAMTMANTGKKEKSRKHGIFRHLQTGLAAQFIYMSITSHFYIFPNKFHNLRMCSENQIKTSQLYTTKLFD